MNVKIVSKIIKRFSFFVHVLFVKFKPDLSRPIELTKASLAPTKILLSFSSGRPTINLQNVTDQIRQSSSYVFFSIVLEG